MQLQRYTEVGKVCVWPVGRAAPWLSTRDCCSAAARSAHSSHGHLSRWPSSPALPGTACERQCAPLLAPSPRLPTAKIFLGPSWFFTALKTVMPVAEFVSGSHCARVFPTAGRVDRELGLRGVRGESDSALARIACRSGASGSLCRGRTL